jgi:V/A-type H+-transporting ATPase subunit I
MQKIRIIALKREANAVTEAMGDIGVIELTKTRESTGDKSEGKNEEKVRQYRDLQDHLEDLAQQLGVDTEGAYERDVPGKMTFRDVRELVDSLKEKAQPIQEKLNALDEQIKAEQRTLEEIAPYRELDVPPARLRQATLLHVMAGDMPADQIPAARDELPDDCVLVPIGRAESSGGSAKLRRVLALSSRRSRFALETVLDNYQFEETEIPSEFEASPAAIYKRTKERIEELQDRRARERKLLYELGEAYFDQLRKALEFVKRQVKISEAEQNYGSTWATVVITGWTPEDQVERVRKKVRQVASEGTIFELSEATQEEIEQGLVPTCAELPAFLQPFQRLVHGFGVPGYREIEPTLLFAISFLLMFGIMFGDLGHGLCLLAIGIPVWKLTDSQSVRDGGYLIAAAGLSSVLFGAFFQGSFFGHSLVDMGWPVTLGFEPIQLEAEGGAGGHVIRYMMLAVSFGIMLITLGLILNIVGRLRIGDYENGFLGRFGLAGFMFYWGVLGMVFKTVVMGWESSDAWLLLFAVILPLFVLAFHEPIYALLTGKRPILGEHPVIGLFEGLIEMLETAITYLANTFSFLRVAAFALSHVALGFTIFILQELVSDLPAGFIWSVLLFLLGTAVIVGLEGFIVAIQIFRLEYYEFFTKFFRGEGKRFSPFRFREEEV